MAKSLDEDSNFANITFLQLVPIVLAFYICGKMLNRKKIILFVDNVSLVYILNKQSSRSDRVMPFLRPLVLSALQNNIQFKAKHVSGSDNNIPQTVRIFQEANTTCRHGPQAHSRVIPVIAFADEVDRLLAASGSVNTHNTYRAVVYLQHLGRSTHITHIGQEFKPLKTFGNPKA